MRHGTLYPHEQRTISRSGIVGVQRKYAHLQGRFLATLRRPAGMTVLLCARASIAEGRTLLAAATETAGHERVAVVIIRNEPASEAMARVCPEQQDGRLAQASVRESIAWRGCGQSWAMLLALLRASANRHVSPRFHAPADDALNGPDLEHR